MLYICDQRWHVLWHMSIENMDDMAIDEYRFQLKLEGYLTYIN